MNMKSRLNKEWTDLNSCDRISIAILTALTLLFGITYFMLRFFGL